MISCIQYIYVCVFYLFCFSLYILVFLFTFYYLHEIVKWFILFCEYTWCLVSCFSSNEYYNDWEKCMKIKFKPSFRVEEEKTLTFNIIMIYNYIRCKILEKEEFIFPFIQNYIIKNNLMYDMLNLCVWKENYLLSVRFKRKNKCYAALHILSMFFNSMSS